MGKKRRAVEPTSLEDGYYWFRNYINLRGGGHADEWQLARIVVGRVQRFGSAGIIDPDCPYLRRALWVRIEPPDAEIPSPTAIRLGSGDRPARESKRDDASAVTTGAAGGRRDRVRFPGDARLDGGVLRPPPGPQGGTGGPGRPADRAGAGMTDQNLAPSAGGEGGAGGFGGDGGRSARFTRYRLPGNKLTLIRAAPANAGLSGVRMPSTVAK